MHLAVVADPVQRRRVVAGRGDRLVPDGVALLAGVTVEHGLDHTLAAAVRHGAGQLAHDALETLDGRGDRDPHLLDLPGVLDQPQLGDRLGQGVVVGGDLGLGPLVVGADALDQRRDRAVGLAQHPHPHAAGAGVLGQGVGEAVQVLDRISVTPRMPRAANLIPVRPRNLLKSNDTKKLIPGRKTALIMRAIPPRYRGVSVQHLQTRGGERWPGNDVAAEMR